MPKTFTAGALRAAASARPYREPLGLNPFRRLALLIAVVLMSALGLAASPAEAQHAGGRLVRVAVAGPGDAHAGGHGHVRLFVRESGHGEPIVLLHGFGASGYFWRKIMPTLARSHRVIAIDMKGFGRSDKPMDGRYSVTEQARVVTALIRAMGLKHITLIGHSLGGAVSLAVAIEAQARDPGMIGNLVLISAPAYPQPIPNTIALLQRPRVGELVLDLVPPEVIAQQTLIGASAPGRPIDPADVAAYAMPLRSPGGKEALIASARTFDPALYTSLINRIGTIRVRTLVMICRADNIVPLSTAERLARTIPRAELTVFDGCNHVPPEEKPGPTVHRILTFLGK